MYAWFFFFFFDQTVPQFLGIFLLEKESSKTAPDSGGKKAKIMSNLAVQ